MTPSLPATIPYDTWFSPSALLALAQQVGEALDRECEVRSQRGKPFREGYMAARFALVRGAEAVRLLSETAHDTPDFAIRVDGAELIFENTEADAPEHRRNESYEAFCRRFTHGGDPLSDAGASVEPDVYAAEIARLMRKKAAKDYPRCDGIILRSNAAWIIGLADPPLDWWEAACAPARGVFDEVWVFHAGRFFRLFIADAAGGAAFGDGVDDIALG
ncbi:hypothetical protein GTZ99_04330 [Novosphingobium sp. FSY-8]|uniref:Uncharacterized protein n=1 Tax=Novosphingobium ovatum TaxID=1908523 RepID=A0ABW9XB65_9SPHN|nr:hypothetical protein [Novosphingobium ovatum]NBC35781.1 hypothetical protein [Novosphingobium ovatum]